MNFEHVTVLKREAVEALRIREDGIYVDGTAGGGGHSSEIAQRLGSGRLIAVDKDPDAVSFLRERFRGQPCVQIVQGDFRYLPELLDRLGIAHVDGILLDLGVSSHQLDTPSRGFSYQSDARLDMRMSGSGPDAYELVNRCEEGEIIRILREYGEERYAARIARGIVRAREQAPVETTGQLAEIIRDAIPAPARRTGGHPAKRSFQAIRIAVNGELEALEECLRQSFDLLNAGGRFAVITFHSLEDRMVKRKFAELCRGCVCPPEYPVCVCGRRPRGKAVTRKPMIPSEVEISGNRRAHSAKLRVVEKME